MTPSITAEQRADWETCAHKFDFYFGPVKHCRYCGAQTIATVDPKESKPIYPPIAMTENGNG